MSNFIYTSFSKRFRISTIADLDLAGATEYNFSY